MKRLTLPSQTPQEPFTLVAPCRRLEVGRLKVVRRCAADRIYQGLQRFPVDVLLLNGSSEHMRNRYDSPKQGVLLQRVIRYCAQ